MGYRVDYQPLRKVRRVKERICGRAALAGIAVLLFLAILFGFRPEAETVVRGLIFSGDGTVTAAALEDMMQDLKAGMDFSSAAEAFCRRILVETDLG